jgi:hypothetical protein
MEKKYPIGGYAPGNYHDRCCTCRQPFQGDKRATQCEPCAIADREKFDALSPEEQQALLTKNAGIANFILSGPLSPEQELIYRIVEQWGNVINMPKMVGWLKEYAAQQAPTGAVLRETIEDIMLKTGKHNQDECSELADMILNDLPKAPTGAEWMKVELERPDCLKVRFKDCYGNIFIGNYSKETNSYYAYGISKEIVNVIEWKPQK